MKRTYYLAALAALSVTAIGTAIAAKTIESDALTVNNAKIPMTQAIMAAEQHAGGKASRAEYEKTKSGRVYEIAVVSGNKVFDVKVDAEKGAVIASAEDKGDRDDDHEEKD